MEDIFDNILYIVIALVAFIISFLGKKKKPPVHARSVEHPFSEPELEIEPPLFKSFEEFLNEQIEVESPAPQKPEEVKSILQEGRSEMIESNSPLTKNYIKQTRGRIKVDTVASALFDDDLTKSEQKEDNFEEFDLKQAVIGAEILNRKQY